MAITKVINDLIDLNQTGDYSGIRLPEGTTADRTDTFIADYLIVAGGGGTGTDSPGGGGAGGLRTSYNNSTTTTNTLSFPSGKTAIATYMLDGNATDVSGNYNGTETSITYNTGKYGGAAILNGSNSFIQTLLSLNSNDVSISFWAKADTLGGSRPIYMINNRNGILVSYAYTSSSNSLTSNTSSQSTLINSTTWTSQYNHIVVNMTGFASSYSLGGFGAAVNIEVFLNGNSIGTTTQTPYGQSDGCRIGRSNGTYYFDGSIDQVRVYESALSSTDVTNIYNNEVQINSGGGTAAESSLTLAAGTSYDVTVGAGGFKTFGGNSVFSNITSTGGGAGGGSGSSSGYNGGNGGSGGGASGGGYSLPGGNGTTAQGYAGGGSGSQAGAGYPGGGGGGASAKGQTLATSSENGGAGGNGVITNILNSTNAASSYIGEVSGSNVYYSGGGGGSTYTTTLGTGGLGGGADGQKYTVAQTTNNGTTNTGGGGGAQNSTGGSGVVILRYPTANVASFTTSGTLITPSATDTVANTAYPVANEAYYKLDGDVVDSTGTHTANAYSITYSNSGVYNQAAKFDGSGYIDSGYTAVSSTSASISLWVNITAYTTYGGFAIDSLGTGAQTRFTLGQGTGTSGNLWVSVGNGSSVWYDESTVSLAGYGLNTWFHLVGTVNGTTVKIYINGSLIHTFTSGVSYVGGGQHNYYFGGWGNSLKLNGLMDQIRFYSTDLSQAYVTDLYKEHYKTLYTEGSDTILVFNRGSGTINFTGTSAAPPSGALRTNTSYSEDGSGSAIEHYNGTEWKYFDAIKYCTTNTLNFPPGAGCIASYNLNNNVDDIGNTYNGVNSNVTFNASGKFGAAAVFNGSSSIIKDVLGSGFTYATKTMTFSAWIFVTDNSNDNVIIGDGFSNSSGGWLISTGYGSAPNQKLNFSRAGSVGGVQQAYGSVTIPDDTWTHIAVSVDFPNMATNSSIKMYINGTEDTSLTDGISSAFQDNTTYNTSIGGTWLGSAARLFEGSIDQVRIFNSALTSDQVEELYNNEIACS